MDLSRPAAPGSVFFDVGAHVGFHTLPASRLVGPRGHVFAFEPLPQNLRSQGHLAADGPFEVRTVTLDGVAGQDGVPVPDDIRIDIEGGELAALSGGRSLLSRAHPTPFCATHPAQLNRECRNLLTSLGYQVRAVDGASSEQADELVAQFAQPSPRRGHPEP